MDQITRALLTYRRPTAERCCEAHDIASDMFDAMDAAEARAFERFEAMGQYALSTHLTFNHQPPKLARDRDEESRTRRARSVLKAAIRAGMLPGPKGDER